MIECAVVGTERETVGHRDVGLHPSYREIRLDAEQRAGRPRHLRVHGADPEAAQAIAGAVVEALRGEVHQRRFDQALDRARLVQQDELVAVGHDHAAFVAKGVGPRRRRQLRRGDVVGAGIEIEQLLLVAIDPEQSLGLRIPDRPLAQHCARFVEPGELRRSCSHTLSGHLGSRVFVVKRGMR